MKKRHITTLAKLITVVLLSNCGGGSTIEKSKNSKLEIKHPITGERIEVGMQDFEMKMDYEAAGDARSKIGLDWRLPTIEEIKAMYTQLHMNEKGDFKKQIYWCEDGTFNFANGKISDTSHYAELYVRPVRFKP
jgi:hypothetical protein